MNYKNWYTSTQLGSQAPSLLGSRIFGPQPWSYLQRSVKPGPTANDMNFAHCLSLPYCLASRITAVTHIAAIIVNSLDVTMESRRISPNNVVARNRPGFFAKLEDDNMHIICILHHCAINSAVICRVTVSLASFATRRLSSPSLHTQVVVNTPLENDLERLSNLLWTGSLSLLSLLSRGWENLGVWDS